MTEEQLKERLAQYRFYHHIQLSDTIATAGTNDPAVIRIWDMVIHALRSIDLQHKRFLDIGCRDGLFSFEAERRGANEIIGFDNDLSRGAVELLIPYLQSTVRMHEANLYYVTPQTFGKFDVVCFAGVLYHLRYPIWGLKIVRDLLQDGGTLILETALYIDDNRRAMLNLPIGRECPGGDPTNCAQFNLKGMVDTLYSLGIVVERVEYLWERGLVRSASEPLPLDVRPFEFDEAFYRQENPDIAEAMRIRHWNQSGYFHYMLHGRAEGRLARLKDGTMVHPHTPILFEDSHYNRAVFTCRKDPRLVNQFVHSYLEATHSVHSGKEQAADPYGDWDRFPRPEPVTRISHFQARDGQ